jgi:hypothetical protein
MLWNRSRAAMKRYETFPRPAGASLARLSSLHTCPRKLPTFMRPRRTRSAAPNGKLAPARRSESRGTSRVSPHSRPAAWRRCRRLWLALPWRRVALGWSRGQKAEPLGGNGAEQGAVAGNGSPSETPHRECAQRAPRSDEASVVAGGHPWPGRGHPRGHDRWSQLVRLATIRHPRSGGWRVGGGWRPPLARPAAIDERQVPRVASRAGGEGRVRGRRGSSCRGWSPTCRLRRGTRRRPSRGPFRDLRSRPGGRWSGAGARGSSCRSRG